MRHEKRGGGMNGSARGGHQHHHQQQAQQRVPNADDFPVLAGSVTPPARSPVVGPISGPTAAQVLQAPAPFRKPAKSTDSPGDESPTLNGVAVRTSH